MRRFFAGLLLFIVPCTAFAVETPITRRDAFLTIWQSIRRPSSSVREKPFTDVEKGSKGFAEIMYAKARGILDDGEEFRPDDSVQPSDALV